MEREGRNRIATSGVDSGVLMIVLSPRSTKLFAFCHNQKEEHRDDVCNGQA